MIPAYIRYFACTDGSGIGALALALARSMEKVAPVRLVSMTGVLIDDWLTMARMTTTPMIGAYVNVVACDPSRWSYELRVPMPSHDAWVSATRDTEVVGAGKVEVASARHSLYTAGVRNVLFAVAPPRDRRQLEDARAFESVIVPNEEHRKWWVTHAGRDVRVIGYPIPDFAVREELVGPE